MLRAFCEPRTTIVLALTAATTSRFYFDEADGVCLKAITVMCLVLTENFDQIELRLPFRHVRQVKG